VAERRDSISGPDMALCHTDRIYLRVDEDRIYALNDGPVCGSERDRLKKDECTIAIQITYKPEEVS